MIDIVGLTKKFEKKTVLDDITFQIRNGSVFGLVGTNGAGKSTLLRLAAGVYRPDGGTVQIDGEDVFDSASVKEKSVFISDDSYFPTGASVSDIEKTYSVFYKNFDKTEFSEIIGNLGFKRDDKINSFSKGMKKQLFIAAAIACNTEYIFLDETFDGLDPIMRNYVKKLIYSKIEERNLTVLLTSHDIREIESFCDSVCVIHNGRPVVCGDVCNIKTNVVKVQVAYTENSEPFENLDIEIVDRKSIGSVHTLIVRGNSEEIVEKLRENAPVILDILPLSLEEIFIYETEAVGYAL